MLGMGWGDEMVPMALGEVPKAFGLLNIIRDNDPSNWQQSLIDWELATLASGVSSGIGCTY